MASNRLPPVCVLAGGLGQRLGALTAATPKPLLEVAGEPFLIHQLRQLAATGTERVVLCVGYLGQQIEARLGSSQFGIAISYSYDGPELEGTLGAIRRAAPLLDDRFLVLYGDTYLRVNYERFVAGWVASKLPAAMTVLRNDGQWGTSNVVFAAERVVRYEKGSPDPEMRWIDYGLGGLTPDALSHVDASTKDLAELQRTLARKGRLFGFEVFDRFYEIGSPEALAETETFLASNDADPGPALQPRS